MSLKKVNIFSKITGMILAIGLGTQVQAIDLKINSIIVNNGMPVTGNSQFSVEVKFINVADTDNPESVNSVNVTIDQYNDMLGAAFNFVMGSESANAMCFESTMGTDCTIDYSSIPLPADDSTQTLTFNMTAGNTALTGAVFNATVSTFGTAFPEPNPDANSNTTSTTVDLTPGVPVVPDLALSASGQTSFLINEGDTSVKTISLSLVNNGADAMSGAVVSLSYDNTRFFADLITGEAGWMCTPSGGGGAKSLLAIDGVDCVTQTNFAANDPINLTFKINALASAVSDPNQELFALSTYDVSMVESFMTQNDNNVSIDATIVTPAPALELTTNESNPLQLTEGDTAAKTYDFKLTNSGADSTSGVTVDFSFNTSVVTVSGVSAANYTCNSGSAETYQCVNGGNVASASETDFQIQYSLAGEVGVDLYSSVMMMNAVTGTPGGAKKALLPAASDTLIVDINVAPLLPEYQMTAENAQSKSLSITAGTDPTTIPYSFELTNLGPGNGMTGEYVAIDLATGFTISSPTIVTNPNLGGGSWSCTARTGGFDCMNSSTGNGMTALDKVVFSGNLTAIPSSTGLASDAIKATVMSNDVNTANDSASYNITINPAQTNLQVLKSAVDNSGNSITSVVLDSTFKYYINVNNLSATAATGVSIVDNVPAGLQITGHQVMGSWDCTISTFVNATTSQSATCTHPNIPANQTNFSEVLALEMKAVAVGSYNNITNNVTSNETDSDLTNNKNATGSAQIAVVMPDPDITITKSIKSGVTSGEAVIGTQVVYKILVDNLTANSNNGADVVITDVLPAGVTYVSHAVLGANITSCSYDTPSTTLSCAPAVIPFSPPDDGVEITVNVTGTAGTSVTNTATVTSINDVNTANNSASSAAFTIKAPVPEVDLSLVKSSHKTGEIASTVSFLVGQNFDYKLKINNTGPNDALIGEVDVVDALPSGIDLVSTPNPTDWDCSATSGNTVSCTNTSAILATSGTSEIIIPVVGLAETAAITNTASVNLNATAISTELTPTANDGSIAVAILSDQTTLEIQQKAYFGGQMVSSIPRGESYEYKIDVSNTGSNSATNVIVEDFLPTEVQYDSFSGTNWDCNLSTGTKNSAAGTYVCNYGIDLLASTAATTLILMVTDTSSVTTSSHTNQANVDSDNSPSKTSSNTVTIVNGDALVTVTQNPDPVEEGEVFEVSIDIKNNGSVNLQNTSLSYELPTGFSLQTPAKFASSCTPSGNTMNCSVNNDILPAASELIKFNVIAINPAVEGSTYNAQTIVQSDTLTNDITINTPINVFSSDTTLEIKKDAYFNGQITSSIPRGETYEYKILVTNTGSFPAKNVFVEDTMPNELTVNNFSGANWDCSGGGVKTQKAAGVEFCNYTVDLPANSSTTLVFNVTDTSISPTTQHENVVNAGADNAVQVNDTNTLPIVDGQALVTVTQNPDPVVEGQVYEVSIDIKNNGSTSLKNTIVSHEIPTGFSFQSAASKRASTCTSSGNLLNCTVDNDILAAGSEIIKYNITAINPMVAGTTYNAQTIVQSDSLVSDVTIISPINVVTSQTTLSVQKDAYYNGQITSSIPRGETYEYRILVSNTGSNDAKNLILEDTMPNELTVNGFTGANWNCNNGGTKSQKAAGLESCNYSVDLPVNGSTTLVFNVTDTSAGSTTEHVNVVNVSANNSEQATDTNTLPIVDGQALVTVTQNPDPVQAGQEFEIVVDVLNNGSSSLKNTSIIAELPPGFSLQVGAKKTSTCSQSGNTYTCNVDNDILAGQTETVQFNVLAVSPFVPNTTYNTQITVKSDGLASDVVINSNIDVIEQLVEDFELTLTDSKDPVEVEEIFSYTATIENTGTTAITEMSIDIDVTNNLTIDSFLAANFDCTISASLLTCNSKSTLDIPAQSNIEVVRVFAKSDSFTGTLTSNASASTIDQPTKTTQTTSENTTFIPKPDTSIDLAINKTASLAQVVTGSDFSYTLQVTNNSPNPASNVVITDTLPQNLVLDSVTGTGCNNVSPIVCNIPTLASQASETITIQVKAGQIAGLVQNTATVSAAEVDSNSANNNSQANVSIVEPVVVVTADLSIEKTADVEVIESDGVLNWKIKATNKGPDPATQVVITDNLPAGFVFDSMNASANANCTKLTNTIECTAASMAKDEIVEITIKGTTNIEEGELKNTVSITSNVNDTDGSNNNSEAIVKVIPKVIEEADLQVDVTAGANIQQGESTVFTVNVKNNGPNVAVNPKLNLTLTGLIDKVEFNTPDWNCEVNGSTAECTRASLSVGQTSQLQITVKTREVVIESENIGINATITSDTLDSIDSNNAASSSITVEGTPEEGSIEDAMLQALTDSSTSVNPQVQKAIESVASYCEGNWFTALDGLCQKIYDKAVEGDGEFIDKFMKEVSPTEVIGQKTSVTEIFNAQNANISARISELKGGGGSGGLSIAGLNARYGNGSIPLEMLSYLRKDAEESSVASDFVSPWGFFINGTISMGERDQTERELGFDFETYGLTAGVDYRFSSDKVVGLALGYANFDSKVGDDTAELVSKGMTLTAYGSFYVNDHFYVDSRISVGKPKFKQTRKIEFALGGVDINKTAIGETDSNQYTTAINTGYHFNKNSWNITPNASLRYTRTKINQFEESGADAFNFFYNDQIIESMVWSAGVSVSRAISLKKGVFTPQFDFNYNYETENDGNEIVGRFLNAPTDEIFIIETDSPDRAYGTAGIGFVYVTSNGKQAYINYRSTLGLDGFERGTINLGARFEF